MAFPLSTALLERLRLVREGAAGTAGRALVAAGSPFEPEQYSPNAPGSTVSNANRPSDVTVRWPAFPEGPPGVGA